jgi:parallel beta-helix repeat protein
MNVVTNNGGTGISFVSDFSYLNGNIISNNTGIGIHLQGTSNCKLIGNVIAFNGDYGILTNRVGNFMGSIESSNNSIYHNNFLSNKISTGSQACDNELDNIFSNNHWNDWTEPDNNGDGIVDQYYPIAGSANNTDRYPSTERIHLVLGVFLTPRYDKPLTGVVTLQWIAIDTLGHDITYSLSYSIDGGATWTQLVTGLTSPFYAWDTSTIVDCTQLLIQVTASCSEGVCCVLTSDTTFTTDNLCHFQPFSVIFPKGGDTLFGPVTIQWTPAVDIFIHVVTYAISYSPDNGLSWVTLISGLTNLSYIWDSNTAVDGSQYLIQVNASCIEGSWRVITSGTFTLDNIPSLSSLPLTYISDSSFQPDVPLDLLPVLQILTPVAILAFLITLVIIVRRKQIG